MNRKLFLIVNLPLLFFFTFGDCAFAQTDIGHLLLDNAEKFQQEGNFDDSLRSIEGAIEVLKKSTEKSLLARAYFYRAFALISKGATEKEIAGDLVLAYRADPEYEPPESLRSHPTISKAITIATEEAQEARRIRRREVRRTFNDALLLLAVGKHCEAVKLLEPIVDEYESPDVARKVVDESKRICNGTGEIAAKAEKIAQSAKRRMGIFPIISEDSENNKIIKVEVLTQQIRKEVPDLDIILVKEEKARQLQQRYRFQHYKQFVTGGWWDLKQKSILDMFREKGISRGDRLTDKIANLLKEMCVQEQFELVMFVAVENESPGDFSLERKFTLNVYDVNNPKEPVVNEYYRTSEAPDMSEEIGALRNYLKLNSK